MRVIDEPAVQGREVMSGRGAGSRVLGGSEGASTFVCGRCRAILVRNRAANSVVTSSLENDEFVPVDTVRDIVFKCKGCGALNEVA